jgi:YVTN family beta-propeller protein
MRTVRILGLIASAGVLAAPVLAAPVLAGQAPAAGAATSHPITAYVLGGIVVTPIDTAAGKAGSPIAIPAPNPQAEALWPMAVTPDGQTLYVGNEGQFSDPGNTVTPVSTASNKPGKAIAVGLYPDAIAVAPNGKTTYVANMLSNTVTPLRTATGSPLKAISAGVEPSYLAVTPNSKTVYVAGIKRSVIPISAATDKPGKAIKVAGTGPIAITPNGKTAYVLSEGSATITPIRTATNTARTAISLGSGVSAQQIVIAPDGRTAYVYVVSRERTAVAVISTATSKVVKTVKIGSGGPLGPITGGPLLAITPSGKTVYAIHDNTVTPIRTATDSAPKAITGFDSAAGIAITPDGKTAYVVNGGTPTVIPIRTATNQRGKPIDLAAGEGQPDGPIVITP